jgi:hypothetical protein
VTRRRESVGMVTADSPWTMVHLLCLTLTVLVVTSCAGASASPSPAEPQSASPPPVASSTPAPSSAPRQSPMSAWTATGTMIDGRVFFTATLLPDGKVLVVGGFRNGDGTGPLASAELYDPTTASWTATGKMLQARAGHTATLLPDGTVLVAGGGTSPSDTLRSAESYDPRTGSWSATGSMTKARGSHTAILLRDGRVLVAGGGVGISSSGIEASAELYDPKGRSWAATGKMRDARTLHTATLLTDGKVLVSGGQSRSDTALASAELYDPVSESWIVSSNMITGRAGHTVALLHDGKVLVAGGVSGGFTGDLTPSDILASAELYDPASGSWKATGSMVTPRFGFVATRLPDGRVLVAAGDTLGSPPLDAELYDPNNGSWTATGNLINGRAGHTAALLPDGKVLVVGGEGPGGIGLASAELYDPGAP